jgi:predicted pyridoxine 5'-phosphate oxidase superfamily flavin-nucleotide-binding protein
MSEFYHRGNRQLQDRFDSRRLADRLEQVKLHAQFNADDKTFIEQRDMFFLATADEHGQPNCSYKGGDPGFVRVLDEQTLAFPVYDGNGMYISAGNLLVNGKVGLLFIDFEGQRRVRVNGRAELAVDTDLLALFPGAEAVVLVHAEHIFPNCPRYIHRYVKAEASPYVPRPGEQPPVPAWKRAPWASDVLPQRGSPESR